MKNYDEIRNHFYGTLGFIQLLDMRITELSEGYCKGEMPLRPEILNPLGTVHGGCTFALADTIGGSAALTHGNSVVTVDSNIHYLAPACNTEKLIAEAKEIKYGSTIAVYEVNVYKTMAQWLPPLPSPILLYRKKIRKGQETKGQENA